MSISTITYGAALKVFAKTKQLSKALDLLQEMKQSNVARDTATYNMLIRACAMPEQKDAAVQLFEQQMQQEEQLKPNVLSYGVLMHQLYKAQAYDKVKHYFAQMQQQHSTTRPTQFIYHILLKTCQAQDNDIVNARKYIKLLKQQYPHEPVEARVRLTMKEMEETRRQHREQLHAQLNEGRKQKAQATATAIKQQAAPSPQQQQQQDKKHKPKQQAKKQNQVEDADDLPADK